MLDQMRRSAKSGFSYILVGLLIVVFAVFFGAPPEGCRSTGGRVLMATVAGNQIHTDDVNIIYHRYFNRQRSSAEDQFRVQQAQALRTVIIIHLLAERAKEMGLRVSDDEFRQFMTDPYRNIEFMQQYGRTGVLDGDYYKRYVQNGLGVVIQRYEDFKRQELLARKYLAMLDMQIVVTDADITELHKLRETKVNLEYVKFSNDTLEAAVNITDADVARYIASHTKELQEHFEKVRGRYVEPEQVLVRRIYIVKPEDQSGQAEAQARFDAAKARVDGGEDFATVASEFTEDLTKERGGLMEWTNIEFIDQNIARALAGAEPGSVHAVTTDFALMLVKLEDRKAAKSPALTDVQDELARELLKKERVEAVAANLAKELFDKAREKGSLEEALSALQQTGASDDEEEATTPWTALTVRSTGMFSLEGQQMPAMLRAQFPGMNFGRDWDEIPGIGKNTRLALEAFELSEANQLASKIYDVDGAKVVVALKDRQEPEELTAEARMRLEAELRNDRTSEILGPWQMLFFNIAEDYGPLIEKLYREAIANGTVRLHDRNSATVPLVRDMVVDRNRDSALALPPGLELLN
jgi:peptidyl-prolyl cis-trans isomerase D